MSALVEVCELQLAGFLLLTSFEMLEPSTAVHALKGARGLAEVLAEAVRTVDDLLIICFP